MKLVTNLALSNLNQDDPLYLSISDFTSILARWLVSQSPYDAPDTQPALQSFSRYMRYHVGRDGWGKFTQSLLRRLITEEVFERIPAIAAFNVAKKGNAEYVFVTRYSSPHPDYDFVDLGALARNVMYDLVRQGLPC